jgi:hypothetical protein
MRSRASRFFRNPRTGEIVVAQKPNAPLWLYLAATVATVLFRPDGTIGTLLSALTTLALVVWALLEITRGDSPFRRTLGAVVLAAIVVGLLRR